MKSGNRRRYTRRHNPGPAHRLTIHADADPRLAAVFKRIGKPKSAPFEPDPFQLAAVDVILSGKDCLVTAPTGSGKTWIAVEAIRSVLSEEGTIWYASPLKALSNSKYIEFAEAFGAERTGILTGDRKENADAPVIVGTTEILRNHLYDAMRYGQDLKSDLVVLDEAHFLGDPERGVVWEEIMIYLPQRIPLLLLSATVGNADQIAAWLMEIRKRPCIVIHESKRPVPLHPVFFHPSGTLMPLLAGKSKSGKPRLYKKVHAYLSSPRPSYLAPPGKLPPFHKLLDVLRTFDLLPAIFFLKSRADCDAAIEICASGGHLNHERTAAIDEMLSSILAQVPHLKEHRHLWHLSHLGVGSHHGGQLPAWKLTIEQLMSCGLLEAVFATSTVAAGVNFPARSVLFLNSDKFNGVEFLPLSPTEFHQMTGRAGRRGMDRIGFALPVPGKYMDVRLFASLFGAPPSPVDSQIQINFSMTLNLLLSHTPDQIEALLRRSFAAFQHRSAKSNKGRGSTHSDLFEAFIQHFHFMQMTGYVDADGTLTASGLWASQLRIDFPLLLAEALQHDLLPTTDARLLVAIIAAFVNDRDTDERRHKARAPNKLKATLTRAVKGLRPFQRILEEYGFPTRVLQIMPAYSLYLWSTGLFSWDAVRTETDASEGDLAMLILRTADHLRHLIALRETFPEMATAASEGLEMILREPLLTHFS